MKKLLTVLIVIAIIIGLWIIFSDSEVNDAETPATVTPTPEFNIGFDSIMTDSQVVWRLLDQDIAESLRFYNAMTDQTGQRTGMILVGVNSDGGELNDPNDIGYIYLDESGAHQSLSHAEAKRFANYVNQNRDISNMISEISKSDMPREFDRMIIRPDEYRDNRDSTYATVRLYTYAYSSDLRLTNELRTQPCPPLCAYEEQYLYNPLREEIQQGDNDDENEEEEEEDERNGEGDGDRY